jgi:hypothetical protein
MSSNNNDIDQTDLEIWKTVVGIQMHFNDLELRIRNFAILSLGAILTVAGYSLRDGNIVQFNSLSIPFASIILLVGAVIWLCFWYMDRHWYHRLLLGAVMHGIKIERKYSKERPSLGLSESIKEHSPNQFLSRRVRSQHRLNLFYWVIAFLLVLVALSLFSVMWAAFFMIGSILLGVVIFFVTTDGVE